MILLINQNQVFKNSLVRLNKIQFELLNYWRYYLLFFIPHVFYCEDVFSKEVFIPADHELYGYKPAPLAGFVVNFTISDFNGFATSCKNSNDGSIDLTITGGSPPYTFSWSNSSTTEDIINLDAGNYSVLVSDSTGDTASFSFLLNEPDSLTIGFTAIQPICGNNNGISEVVVAGGISPYTVLWSTGDTSNSVSNLGSGMYSVIVSGLNSCQVGDSLELIDVGSPVININNITHVSCSGGANGALDLTISGGTAPYTYSWSNNSPT